MQTFDMVLIPNEIGAVLLVAMGNEGLLVHRANGGWEMIEGYNPPDVNAGIQITPTPFAARSSGDAINTTSSEFLIAVTTGLLTWYLLSIWIRENILYWIETPTSKKINAILLPARIAIVWTLLIPAAILFLTPRFARFMFSSLAVTYWTVLVVLSVWYIVNLSENIPSALRKLDRDAFLCGLLIFLISWLPFGLWAFGVIERYPIALILSIGGGLAMLAVTIPYFRRQPSKMG